MIDVQNRFSVYLPLIVITEIAVPFARARSVTKEMTAEILDPIKLVKTNLTISIIFIAVAKSSASLFFADFFLLSHF